MAIDRKDIDKIVVDYTDIVNSYQIDINNAIDRYCNENNIENIKSESQSVFNGLLRYIGKNVFYDKSKLKDKTYIDNPTSIYRHSTFNRYNYDLIEELANIYYDLCFITYHEISIIGLSFFLNINYNVLYSWLDNNNNNSINSADMEKLTGKRMNIIKNTIALNEESLANKLYSSAGNNVGTIAILNHRFNWTTSKVEYVSSSKTALSAADLPVLDDKNSQTLQLVDNEQNTAQDLSNMQ